MDFKGFAPLNLLCADSLPPPQPRGGSPLLVKNLYSAPYPLLNPEGAVTLRIEVFVYKHF